MPPLARHLGHRRALSCPSTSRQPAAPRRPLATPLPQRCCGHAARPRHLATRAAPEGIRWTERGPGRPPFGQASGQTSVLPLVSAPYTDPDGKTLTPVQAAVAVRALLTVEAGSALAGLSGSGLAFRQPQGEPTAAAAMRGQAREKLLARLESAPPLDASTASAMGDSLDVGQLAVRQRLIRLATALGEGLVERDAEVKLLLLALICAQHALLCGPSGSGKSILGRRLSQAVAADTASNSNSNAADSGGGVRFFERQLTRFSVPEELFGPVSLKALRGNLAGDSSSGSEGQRASYGYLPSATVGFIDQVFNASSGLLNSLLTLLNERKIEGSDAEVRLRTVVATCGEP